MQGVTKTRCDLTIQRLAPFPHPNLLDSGSGLRPISSIHGVVPEGEGIFIEYPFATLPVGEGEKIMNAILMDTRLRRGSDLQLRTPAEVIPGNLDHYSLFRFASQTYTQTLGAQPTRS